MCTGQRTRSNNILLHLVFRSRRQYNLKTNLFIPSQFILEYVWVPPANREAVAAVMSAASTKRRGIILFQGAKGNYSAKKKVQRKSRTYHYQPKQITHCSRVDGLALQSAPFVDLKTVRTLGGRGGDGSISFLQLWVNDKAGKYCQPIAEPCPFQKKLISISLVRTGWRGWWQW